MIEGPNEEKKTFQQAPNRESNQPPLTHQHGDSFHFFRQFFADETTPACHFAFTSRITSDSLLDHCDSLSELVRRQLLSRGLLVLLVAEASP